MKKWLAFAAVMLFPIALSAQSWHTGSLEDALAAAKAAGKPLLVDFFAETG